MTGDNEMKEIKLIFMSIALVLITSFP